MSSNSHIHDAANWLSSAQNTRDGEAGDRLEFAKAEAFLAIAYELRTANLLAWRSTRPLDFDGRWGGDEDLIQRLQ
jgi:hypothetical protein